MKLEVKRIFQNERGNIALFVIGILAIMMVLFVFILNLSKVFAVKEQANSTSQQASLAATAVLYDQIEVAIKKYEDETLPGLIDKHPKSIAEKIDEKIIELNSNPNYSDYSSNEISIEAVDIVLRDELSKGIGKEELAKTLEDEIEQNIIKSMTSEARQTILENNGNLQGATLTIDDGQVHVKASNTVEATSYDGFFNNFAEELFQTSAGPKIDFLEYIPFFGVGERSLE
ncbi:hypothetical protein JOC86_004863 [Bacillus pakistanensis]|uniref:Putative Flp pilus-assembly TadG-like N-terminal domain-containing protein n=1 Tax=Rossellomorea pakistanensis TaxID=992288 RepID=A0ABS2NL57_9BACI|nr:Tad domain-containing protein [Bacillus pakistanensis]MBM7588266.1 hypothetical protein [Bacillus pakistanensis]